MKLTKNQCNLLLDIIKGSLLMSHYSGIPISSEISKDIDIIKSELQKESLKRVEIEVNKEEKRKEGVKKLDDFNKKTRRRIKNCIR